MNARAGSVRLWLMPACLLLLTMIAAVSWSVVRPGTSPFGPSASPSAPGTSAAPPHHSVEASVTINFDADSSTPYASAEVTAVRRDDTVYVTVGLTARTSRAQVARVRGQVAAGGVWTGVIDKYVQVALVPGYAKSVSSLNERSVQVAWLSGVDVAVIAIERDPSRSADAFFWSDYSGVVRNSLGEVLPSATVGAGTYSITVFEDARFGVWGYADGIVNELEPISTQPVGKLKVTGVSVGSDGVPAQRRTWFGLLPAGAGDPALKTDGSVTWNTAPLGTTGRSVIVGYNEDVKKGGTGVHRVSYTDASGKRRTFKP
jgi:hypothetical protein